MATRVLVSGELKNLVGGRSRLMAEGASVRDLLESVDREHPGFLHRVLPGAQRPSPFSIYVNGREMSLLAGLDTPVGAADEVIILSPMSGG